MADLPVRLNQLVLRLQQALARREWAAVKRLDGEVAALLAGVPVDAAWSAEALQALVRLKAVHATVVRQCDAELATLGHTLARINSQHGRWQAYSQSSGWGDSTQ
ncbi:hypothetical protein [Pelomonas sp. KK5]|uniref:hypothetical protein n=1 Tax=Pelomonas sp. KK5 TaxID=1855730 RepID=UPI00097C5B72|nr:hypothetical protein [Pelomonas sp. KK5]